MESGLKGYFSLDNFFAWAACNGKNSKESRELRAFFNGLNDVGVFDLHAGEASECQKSLSEKCLKFAFYAERSSLADINPKSYHLIAFDPVSPLLYIYFPNLEYRIFLKDLKSTLPSSVAL